MYKKLKKFLIVLISLTVVASLFAGCGSESVSTKEDDSKPITIRFAAPEGSFKDEIDAFAEGFKKKYPNVTIKYEPLAGSWDQKLLVQASSNELADVFWCPDDHVTLFAKKNISLDLTPYLKKNNINANDFFPAMYKTGTVDGKQYMIPRDYNHVVCYYNKKLFQQAGVELPKNGWTWDDFVAAGKKLVKKDGNKIVQYGCVANLNWQAVGIPLILGLGGTVVDKLPGATTGNFNTPETVKAITQIKQLIDDGVLINDFTQGHASFESGKVAMSFHVRPSMTGAYKAIGNDLGVVTFPVLPAKHVVGSGSSGYCVAKTTKYPEMAAKLVTYIVSNEGQEVFMKTGNSVPVRKSLINSDIWKNIPNKDFNQDAFVDHPEADILPLACQLSDPTKSAAVDQAWQKALEALCIGQKSPEDAAKMGQDLLKSAFSGQ